MDHEQYHADTTRISKSGLSKIKDSPAHYWAAYLAPTRNRQETAAMFEGTMLHCAIGEPDQFKHRYIVVPSTAPSRDCLRFRHAKKPSEETLANIAWWDQFDQDRGKRLLLKQEMYDNGMRIADSVRRHPAAAWLLAQTAVVEQVYTWEDYLTGAPCKCMPDWEIPEHKVIVDFKSAMNAGPEGFARAVDNLTYYIQAPFYLDGTGNETFIFIAFEKEPPYAVGVYNTPEDIISIGREEYQRLLGIYTRCKKENVWPAYSDEVVDLKMPAYFYNKFKLKAL